MQIRGKVFETNSSSCHSLVLDTTGANLVAQPFSDYETNGRLRIAAAKHHREFLPAQSNSEMPGCLGK